MMNDKKIFNLEKIQPVLLEDVMIAEDLHNNANELLFECTTLLQEGRNLFRIIDKLKKWIIRAIQTILKGIAFIREKLKKTNEMIRYRFRSYIQDYHEYKERKLIIEGRAYQWTTDKIPTVNLFEAMISRIKNINTDIEEFRRVNDSLNKIKSNDPKMDVAFIFSIENASKYIDDNKVQPEIIKNLEEVVVVLEDNKKILDTLGSGDEAKINEVQKNLQELSVKYSVYSKLNNYYQLANNDYMAAFYYTIRQSNSMPK